MNADLERLRSIRTFPSLIKYLRDDLEWPIETDGYDDLMFDYEPEELGLDAKTAVKVKEIKQLRPLTTNQPWGVFFLNFEPKRLPVVVLRRILRSLVIKKRQSSSRANQATWELHDLLFISSYGESDHRDITFAHFSEDPGAGDLPALKVLGWDDEDTVLHLEHAHRTLRERLRWPDDPADVTRWRDDWSQAFTLRHREVITTSKALAVRLAELAIAIRKRVNRILIIESETGPLRKLHAAFKEALIHDLSEDDFADMYAQTVTYGLLSARIMQFGGQVSETMTDLVSVTNPFLQDLLSTFLTIGGRKGKIDFDEVGINEVRQTLLGAKMEDVLRDFGDRNPEEDPVVHFYELFLKEYDPKKRMQRGVFYTPRPVVSFIVRSVDEILRAEFGLPDGLADTATWGDMARRYPDLKIPKGAKPEDPFVQILDPACGTGTFLVEVIDTIHKTMTAKWQAEGHSKETIRQRWNDYVPDHLLPRLYGFELMMAPYAVAHMKIGLKLSGTGYRFRSHERARIYLTNSLEPPQDFSDRLAFDAPALAHEAQAVNVVKRDQRFTVVIGNPPYSGISSNMTEHAQKLVDAYKIVDGEALNERKLWLQDDYVKFIRNAQITLEQTHTGILGYITNHGYLDNPTFRGMRQSLLGTFQRVRVIDLHGNANKKEQSPDGSEDKNVFDIRQGVAVCLAVRGSAKPSVQHADLWGTREDKYAWLVAHIVGDTPFATLVPDSPFYFFEPQNTDCRAEYDRGWKVTDIFSVSGVGVVTARDSMTVDFDAKELWTRVRDFASLPPEKGRTKYELGADARDWRVETAQADLRASGPNRKKIIPILYRPFDFRFTYYTGNSRGFYASPCGKVMRHMLTGSNRALAVAKSVEIGRYEHAFCTNWIIGHHSVSLKEVNYLFPLRLQPEDYPSESLLSEHHQPRLNLSTGFLKSLLKTLGLRQGESDNLPKGITPEDILHYIYAVFHSPGYRRRYAEFLKIDFPRLPLTSSLELFRALARLGGELVGLHLMESPRLDKPITKIVGKGDTEVAKGHPKYDDRKVFINPARWFEGVPEAVWSFHIGGYQVCEKWLKDRRGRVLSAEDIAHYQKIVVALSETIRLMAEIDRVIEAHGGWPGAFVTDRAPSPKEEPIRPLF